MGLFGFKRGGQKKKYEALPKISQSQHSQPVY